MRSSSTRTPGCRRRPCCPSSWPTPSWWSWRPDQQDYEGTGVTVARGQAVSEVPQHRRWSSTSRRPTFDPAVGPANGSEHAYDCPVAAVLPHSDAMMALGSAGLFSLLHPEEELSTEFVRVADYVRREAEMRRTPEREEGISSAGPSCSGACRAGG